MEGAHSNLKLSRIFLWGFMGSGKSVIGKELALRLDYGFLDLDESIEKMEDLSVADIFIQKGEEYFRKLEHETLKKVIERTDNVVISAGGGTPCYFDNAEIMNRSGVTIFLNVTPKTLESRLKTDEISTRPLVTNKSWPEIMDLYQERQEFYKTAQITVPNNQSVSKCLQRIMEQLESF
jgi:shikimate kinase